MKRPPRLSAAAAVWGTVRASRCTMSVTRRRCGVPQDGLSARKVKQCRGCGTDRSVEIHNSRWASPSRSTVFLFGYWSRTMSSRTCYLVVVLPPRRGSFPSPALTWLPGRHDRGVVPIDRSDLLPTVVVRGPDRWSTNETPAGFGGCTDDRVELRFQPFLVLADQRPELRVHCPGTKHMAGVLTTVRHPSHPLPIIHKNCSMYVRWCRFLLSHHTHGKQEMQDEKSWPAAHLHNPPRHRPVMAPPGSTASPPPPNSPG